MKKFFETEWHKIPFNSFSNTSRKKLPDSNFYNKFYKIFFEKYNGYQDLDNKWIILKNETAEWLSTNINAGDRVLSVGCGIGYIETYLYSKFNKNYELDVFDFAPTAFKWLINEFPATRIHVEDYNNIHGKYNLVYFSAVDYAMNTNDFIELLKIYSSKLTDSGSIILVSASFLKSEKDLFYLVKGYIKDFIISCKLMIKKPSVQFWGWKRTQNEYRNLLRNAGFNKYEDGFIETDNQKTYFIKGFN